ncbi:MAG: nitroreductase family protein [Acidimicrobiales bacterium]|jgi:nitroreductase|nr:nitroreductase family protein [Acidimicrobiales bacterium]MDP6298374.1 nitroreductase family protein [Acidimicrobiales bacterium]HJM28244.1 nitroreductase family protein [Acidimicrobiales bacterium]HJM97716.1 nitroreductase family protein [Acidimicrobiales bacterium]
MKLGLDADGVLTTTRSVRKRLDLDRPVEKEVIEECLDIALQAPTGSNTQGWQWVFITDPDKKKAIADFYGTNYDAYTNQPNQPNYGDDDPRTSQRPKIMDSSKYLREIFHRVPVMMIPCLQGEGRLDTGTPTFVQASAWGSLLPAVWSFMLALRERGLGSAWTTLHLPNEREVADLLGIPFDTVTQGGLFPIAYTIGTEFKLAKRLPGSSLSHWDHW